MGTRIPVFPLLIVGTVSFFSFSARPAFGYFCPVDTGKIEDGYSYFSAVIDVLDQVRIGRDKLIMSPEEAKDPDFGTTFLTKLKLSQQSYQCAVSIISRYETSSAQFIALGSKKMEDSINGLIQANDYHISATKRILAGTPEKDSAEKADMDSDQQVRQHDAWENFGLSATSATYAVLRVEKKASTLTITATQKDALLKKLENSFGTRVNPKEDRVVEFMAMQLRRFLKQKWKVSGS